MDQRPKIQIKLTNTDKAMELIGFLILIAFWVTMIVSYNNFPIEVLIVLKSIKKKIWKQIEDFG